MRACLQDHIPSQSASGPSRNAAIGSSQRQVCHQRQQHGTTQRRQVQSTLLPAANTMNGASQRSAIQWGFRGATWPRESHALCTKCLTTASSRLCPWARCSSWLILFSVLLRSYGVTSEVTSLQVPLLEVDCSHLVSALSDLIESRSCDTTVLLESEVCASRIDRFRGGQCTQYIVSPSEVILYCIRCTSGAHVMKGYSEL